MKQFGALRFEQLSVAQLQMTLLLFEVARASSGAQRQRQVRRLQLVRVLQTNNRP
jgi:hypothetical protein